MNQEWKLHRFGQMKNKNKKCFLFNLGNKRSYIIQMEKRILQRKFTVNLVFNLRYLRDLLMMSWVF